MGAGGACVGLGIDYQTVLRELTIRVLFEGVDKGKKRRRRNKKEKKRFDTPQIEIYKLRLWERGDTI